MKLIRHKTTKSGRAVTTTANRIMKHRPIEIGEYPDSANRLMDVLAKKEPEKLDALIDEVPCKWFIPENAPEDVAVMYLHGGAYNAGHGVIPYTASWLAESIGLRVLAVDYRLAGDAPYPAALDDSMCAYKWLLEEYAPEKLFFIGDSAGGGLALATCMRARDEGMTLPAALGLISPWCDLTCSGESFRIISDHILDRTALVLQAAAYAGANPLTTPYVSPIFGDVSGLPQTIFVAGMAESLMSDSVEMAKKFDEAGIAAEVHLWEELFHDFAIIVPFLKDSAQVFHTIREFFDDNVLHTGEYAPESIEAIETMIEPVPVNI